ncbi:MAG: glycerol-3-phosphate 1-O-acyltransferase PlsY [Verrucomicrobiales bacterium]|nr:glycerol-3-phosphate 1-O-acyltransferase PlsY [Verrucomicrobiales bacterium]
MEALGFILVAIAAYLLGSIPTGYLVARARGVDIRAVGSGNIGATNVFRTLGRGPGIFVLVVDALKGFVACRIFGTLGAAWFAGQSGSVREFFPIVAGLSAVLGHNYTCWLGFKGGKGIATSAGVLLALFPKAFLAVLGVWALVFAVGRYVSLASVAAAVALPVAVGLLGYGVERLVVAVLLSVLAIYKHKSNIQRLLAGTEHRFGKPRASATPPSSASGT